MEWDTEYEIWKRDEHRKLEWRCGAWNAALASEMQSGLYMRMQGTNGEIGTSLIVRVLLMGVKICTGRVPRAG